MQSRTTQELLDADEFPTVRDVRRFWEAHPLCAEEISHPVGSREYLTVLDELKREDVDRFALHLYGFEWQMGRRVLDVGCGPGWLVWNYARCGAEVVGIDLTFRAVAATRNVLGAEQVRGAVLQANAEALPFRTGVFDFVSCAGVLHHTPSTERGVDEIYRVLRPGGQALISLYYRGLLLSAALWPVTRLLSRYLLSKAPGRGAIARARSVEEFVQRYDGDTNPLGRVYTRRELRRILADFCIERMEVHGFPKRLLPFGVCIPKWMHLLFDRGFGILLYCRVRKPV